MLVAAALLASLSAPFGERVEVRLDPGPVVVSIEFASFARDPEGESERTILCGDANDGAHVTLLCEPNFPYLSGAQSVKRWSKTPGFQRFDVAGVPCCTWREGGATGRATFHAYPSTADHLFDLHVSSGSRSKDAFDRKDFEALVASLRIEGRIDATSLPLPPEVYAFRDEVAKQSGEQGAWVRAQCAARVDQWAPHYYLGALGYQERDDDAQIAGYARASALLDARPERTPKETTALVRALDAVAAGHASKKRFKDAIPSLELLVARVGADAPKELARYRSQALYHLAVCCAKTSKPTDALHNLELALQADPDLVGAARTDELLDSLRKHPEFKKLVGT